MLLVTSKPKQISIPFRQTGYETKDSLSKVLIKPVRDSSIEAAQRSKSASLQRITNINKKIQKLQIFKQKLVSEKLKFAKYEKYKNFLDIVDNIIEERWKIEEKSAILIQSTYKGYICRKKYLEVYYI
jgi:IQ calmodulin-binding motif